jgi:hypothetical protein
MKKKNDSNLSPNDSDIIVFRVISQDLLITNASNKIVKEEELK